MLRRVGDDTGVLPGEVKGEVAGLRLHLVGDQVGVTCGVETGVESTDPFALDDFLRGGATGCDSSSSSEKTLDDLIKPGL